MESTRVSGGGTEYIARPPLVAARPPELAALGHESIVYEPYFISCPHRVHLADDVVIAPHASISLVEEFRGRQHEPTLTIGDGCRIGRNLLIACIERIEIGKRVLISDRVFIGDAYHEFRDPDRAVLDQPMSEPEPVRIGDGAFLGVGAAVLPGVTIGEHAYVGANAVVTADVPARSVAVGNPARIVSHWDATVREWRPGAPGDGPAAGRRRRWGVR